MNIKTIRAVTFSPSGKTKETVMRIVRELEQALRCPVAEDDITLPQDREAVRTFEKDELAVFAFPTYAGRIPNKILPYLQTLFQGNNTPAVAVVTFGNRSFDESLKELCVELHAHGFVPFAGAAFVCRHAMSGVLAGDRPDRDDTEQMLSFARDAAGKLAEADGVPEMLHVFENAEVGPYYRPLEESGEPANFLKAKPVTDQALCDRCGICVRVCPMGSIDENDVTKTPGICIKCHACVRRCPTHAKSFDDPSLLSHIRMLEHNFQRRAENTVFL